MMIADNILARSPQLYRLPHRLLYVGEFISIQLVGLQPNRALIRYSPPDPMLLLVAFGGITLRTNEHLFALREADTRALNPTCEYDITTDEIADLLLITLPKQSQYSEIISTTGESCQCHRANLILR